MKFILIVLWLGTHSHHIEFPNESACSRAGDMVRAAAHEANSLTTICVPKGLEAAADVRSAPRHWQLKIVERGSGTPVIDRIEVFNSPTARTDCIFAAGDVLGRVADLFPAGKNRDGLKWTRRCRACYRDAYCESIE